MADAFPIPVDAGDELELTVAIDAKGGLSIASTDGLDTTISETRVIFTITCAAPPPKDSDDDGFDARDGIRNSDGIQNGGVDAGVGVAADDEAP